MARPRKSEHIKEHLLELGTGIFLEKGYSGAGIKEILGRANVPRGSFYNYFDSKEHYAAEVIRHYISHMAERMQGYLANYNGTPMELLENAHNIIVEMAQECGADEGCLMGSMAAEIANSSELCRQAMLEGIAYWVQGFSALFAQAQASGDIRADLSPQQLVGLFWNQWQGALLRMQIEGDPEVLAQSVKDFVQLIRA